jgi:hypothetical protein
MAHPLDTAQPPRAIFAHLDAAVQQLVVATNTLYGGSWDDCAEDLRRRQDGRPYLFRLTFELEDMLGWLAQLKAYEQARGERFADVPQIAAHPGGKDEC